MRMEAVCLMTPRKSSPKRATKSRRPSQVESPGPKLETELGGSDGKRPVGHLIVGIGASAGGLQAFRTFFANMPADSGMAFVLVQHLDPQHRSMLVELLSAATAMPVVEATDGVLAVADHVYVIPPNATLRIAKGNCGCRSRRRRGSTAGRSTLSFRRLPRIRKRTPSASFFPAGAAMARRGYGKSRNIAD